MNNTTIDRLNAAKFPLSLFVVFIHTDLSVYKTPADISLAFLFSNILGRIAVPAFLIISGYLYFSNIKNKALSFDIWKKKVKKRLFSLVIPYIIWNIIYVLYSWTRTNGNYNFNLYKIFIGELLADKVLYPANGPLWFLRDLFIISALSPIIWYIIKKIPNNVGALLFLILSLIPSNFIMQNLYDSTVYFSIGSFFAYNNYDIFQITRKHRTFCIIACVVSIIGSCVHISPFDFWGRLLILCRIPCIISIIGLCPHNIKNISLLNLSMFIFLSHYMIRSAGFSISRYLIGVDKGDMSFCINFLITIIVCIITFCLLQVFFPKLFSFSLGKKIGRKDTIKAK